MACTYRKLARAYQMMPRDVTQTPKAESDVTGVAKMTMPRMMAITCLVMPATFMARGDVLLLAWNDTMLRKKAPAPLSRIMTKVWGWRGRTIAQGAKEGGDGELSQEA